MYYERRSMYRESIKMNKKQQSQFWDLVGNIHIGDQRQKMFRPSSSVVLQTFILDQYNQMQKKWFSDVLKINPYLGWKLVLNFYIIKNVFNDFNEICVRNWFRGPLPIMYISTDVYHMENILNNGFTTVFRFFQLFLSFYFCIKASSLFKNIYVPFRPARPLTFMTFGGL